MEAGLQFQFEPSSCRFTETRRKILSFHCRDPMIRSCFESARMFLWKLHSNSLCNCIKPCLPIMVIRTIIITLLLWLLSRSSLSIRLLPRSLSIRLFTNTSACRLNRSANPANSDSRIVTIRLRISCIQSAIVSLDFSSIFVSFVRYF